MAKFSGGKMKKKILIGIVVMTLLLCGCSSEGSKATGDMAESKSSESESQSARKEEKHEKKKAIQINTEENYVSNEANSAESDELHFIFEIEDVFSITDRGTVVTGMVGQGNLCVGDEIQISGVNNEVIYTTVEGLETLDGLVDEVTKGMNVGILLGEEVSKDSISPGQVVSIKDTVKPVQSFKACIYVSAENEGNENVISLGAEDVADVCFWSRTIGSAIILPADTPVAEPGNTVQEVEFVLENVEVLEVGSSFYISKDGAFVGAGRVTEVIY